MNKQEGKKKGQREGKKKDGWEGEAITTTSQVGVCSWRSGAGWGGFLWQVA